MSAYCIYGIVDPADNQVVYIGFSCNWKRRKDSHRYELGRNRHGNRQLQNLYNARKKQGKNLRFKKLLAGGHNTMLAAEVGHIHDLKKRIGIRCCNVALGGVLDRGGYNKAMAQKSRTIMAKSKKRWDALHDAMRAVILVCKVMENDVACGGAEKDLVRRIFNLGQPITELPHPDVQHIRPGHLTRIKSPRFS